VPPALGTCACLPALRTYACLTAHSSNRCYTHTCEERGIDAHGKADGEGFEPPDALRRLRFSRPVH